MDEIPLRYYNKYPAMLVKPIECRSLLYENEDTLYVIPSQTNRFDIMILTMK